jgi:hypothetical protein
MHDAPSARFSYARRPRLAAASLPLFAALLLASCNKSPKERLAGKWVGDRLENVTASQASRASGWVKGMTWEFAGDKVTVTVPAEPPRSGSFKIAKVEGEKLTLSIARPDGQTIDGATMTFAEDKTLRWDLGDSREIILSKTE